MNEALGMLLHIGSKLRQRRQSLGWTIQKVATLAGVDNGYLSRVERDQAGYSEKSITRIAGALGISVDSLYQSKSNVEDAPSDYWRLPVLDYVQAGSWMAVRETLGDLDTQEFITTNFDYPASTFALRIRGESMQPDFQEGDIVIIAPTIQPRPGDFVVATDETGEATFKRYREAGVNEVGYRIFELIPLNPLYAPMRSDRQKIAIVGVMLEHRRYRR